MHCAYYYVLRLFFKRSESKSHTHQIITSHQAGDIQRLAIQNGDYLETDAGQTGKQKTKAVSAKTFLDIQKYQIENVLTKIK